MNKLLKIIALLIVAQLAISTRAADSVVTGAPSPFVCQTLADGADRAAERAAHYTDALARAKATGKDIAVFQRGSDWNRCAETLYRNVWSSSSFLKAVGSGFVLVAVDNPETVGGKEPTERLSAQTGDRGTPPTSELVSVVSAGGAVFTQRTDGAFMVVGTSPNPAQDALTLTLKPAHGGRILRLDFPTDDSFPNGGPGRAGNAVLTEIDVTVGGARIPCEWAWASVNGGNNFGPWTAVDGVTNKADEGWNFHGGQHVPRTLLVSLKKRVKAGSAVSVQLSFRSQWGQHVAGCVRAAIVDDRQLDADVCAVAAAQWLQNRNAKFSWMDGSHCPRIALMDAQGRAIDCTNKPRNNLTPATMAALVREMRAKRIKRDDLWEAADKASGPAKAELLRQSLDLLDFGGWAGNENCYKFVHDAIRAADPKDESGAVRWLGFGMGAWGGVPWAPENQWWKKLEGKQEPTEADWNEALACIDREVKDPRNRLLKNEEIQHIMQARYDLYLRKLKGRHDDEKIFDILREIAAFDPTTFWGIGATGYLGMYHRTPNPFITYGWEGARQLKPGSNVWDVADTAYYFDHAGSYKLRMAHNGGKDAFTVRRIALMDGTNAVAVATPAAGSGEVGPGRTVEVTLDCGAWQGDRKYTLGIDYTAADGHLENNGGFGVEPLLEAETRAAPRL